MSPSVPRHCGQSSAGAGAKGSERIAQQNSTRLIGHFFHRCTLASRGTATPLTNYQAEPRIGNPSIAQTGDRDGERRNSKFLAASVYSTVDKKYRLCASLKRRWLRVAASNPAAVHNTRDTYYRIRVRLDEVSDRPIVRSTAHQGAVGLARLSAEPFPQRLVSILGGVFQRV